MGHTWKGIGFRGDQARFIPTYVGHTSGRKEHLLKRSVHPHLRGAYTDYSVPFSYSVGSSPPTWGIRNNRCIRDFYSGSSPPTWGIPQSPIASRISSAVHPHLRGAYYIHCMSYRFRPGSSPPTWGIRHRLPALPGESSVHPHLRGAYLVVVGVNNDVPGSSPPTWGIPVCQAVYNGLNRFIPTYVGHTIHSLGRIEPMAVHPHLRGAYFSNNDAVREFNGSSPPTWGILLLVQEDNRIIRFIPTYVGHTAAAALKEFAESGSSPPTWGIRLSL